VASRNNQLVRGVPCERRESKKRETRQRISDEATALFLARGFEAVTLDEVASAAKVSKMTVFNYFARKEELMLDREDDLKLRPFREALQQRPKGEAPVVAAPGDRRMAHSEAPWSLCRRPECALVGHYRGKPVAPGTSP
jgi:AcrR family transcriptional regulator